MTLRYQAPQILAHLLCCLWIVGEERTQLMALYAQLQSSLESAQSLLVTMFDAKNLGSKHSRSLMHWHEAHARLVVPDVASRTSRIELPLSLKRVLNSSGSNDINAAVYVTLLAACLLYKDSPSDVTEVEQTVIRRHAFFKQHLESIWTLLADSSSDEVAAVLIKVYEYTRSNFFVCDFDQQPRSDARPSRREGTWEHMLAYLQMKHDILLVTQE
jgi:hypothetical protein